MSASPRTPVCLDDFEPLAAARISSAAYDYYRSGAGDERTLDRNRDAFDRILLRPRVLRDVSTLDTSTSLFGSRYDAPLIVAPTAFHGLADPGGEVTTAGAAAGAAIGFCMATLANRTIEEVAAASGAGPRWFQLYLFRDRDWSADLIDRATAAGFEAIVVTVDAPVLGRREADIRRGFELPPRLTIANAPRSVLRGSIGNSGLAAYFASMLDPGLDFTALEWLVRRSPLPVLVKGVLRGDDAQAAVESGAAGVIVSNHGGRQLDTTIASIEALPAIRRAVGAEVPVLVDGGVRRGIDVVKALPCGADAVLLGRPILYALAAAGSNGVEQAVAILTGELREAMALRGATSLAGLDQGLIASESPDGLGYAAWQ